MIPDHRFFFVLDPDDRLVQVSDGYQKSMRRFLGHPLWEYMPHAEELFVPLLEQARRTGRPVESTIFYAGGLIDVRIVPSGDDRLTVYRTRNSNLDFTTLASLAESLSQIEQELSARAPEQLDPPAHASLQALP
jgi:hypothetical protein